MTTTLTRRSAIAGLAAAAIATAQPARSSGASPADPVAAPPPPRPSGFAMYGPNHPLAQGEVMPIPDPRDAQTVLMEAEEISARVAAPEDWCFVDDAFGAADLLRARLQEETNRYIAKEWAWYKRELGRIERLLLGAGVAEETVKWAMDDLDCAAVGLCMTAASDLLDVGMEAGQKMALADEPSLIFLPGARMCPACHGNGARHGEPCQTCDGSRLVEAGPRRMLIYIPDGLLETEGERAVA